MEEITELALLSTAGISSRERRVKIHDKTEVAINWMIGSHEDKRGISGQLPGVEVTTLCCMKYRVW